MTDFVFEPPLRLARDDTVRTLEDAAEFARTYVGLRLPHRRDRMVRGPEAARRFNRKRIRSSIW